MAKNIVVLSDGTGQEGGIGYNTNIYKIFNMLEDRTQRQIAFYDPGLGTDRKKLAGLITGAGISKNILDCYNFIFENYEAGDKIYLFGFSRGAATVRSLSSFIHLFGVLPKSRPDLIEKAFKIYKIPNDDKRIKEAEDFIAKHHTMWTKIHFIGCFDTVAALGFPSKFLNAILELIPWYRNAFHNFKLSESIENAYHALSIDDERKTFHPVLWDSDIIQNEKINQKLLQVWFLGMHTDVGGGYKTTDLSDITLVWMLDKAIKHGIRIYPKHKIKMNELPNGFMNNSRQDGYSRFFKRKVRYWPTNRQDKPIIHESVFSRINNFNNSDNPKYTSWILECDHEKESWVKYKDQTWCNE
ncbi:MAG: peptidoglycan-binding protein [Thalassobius sp.]|nr:peptidoglycan-binding protein [Thalassovita sp.]